MSIFDGRGRWDRRDAAATVTMARRLDAHRLTRPSKPLATLRLHIDGEPDRRIDVRTTPTHNGGYRLDWLCPRCGCGARYLYHTRTGWLCRRCANLAYPSSQAHHDLAAWPMVRRKLAGLATRLHTSVDATRAPTRPARMHRRTYERLLDEWWQLRELDNGLWLTRFYLGLGRGMYESIGLNRDQVRPALRMTGAVRRWRRQRFPGNVPTKKAGPLAQSGPWDR